MGSTHSSTQILELVRKRVLAMSDGHNRDRICFLLDYNLEGGKEFRYRSYLHILRSLDGDLGEENVVAGYAIEILQAALLITDDIMDNSGLRRGRPCYYLQRGMATLKDAFFLLAVVRKLIGQKLKRIYSAPLLRTCLGQTLDTLRKSRCDYTPDNYRMIAEDKTGAYTLFLPSAFGYISANRPVPDYLWTFSRLGALVFQIEDDYLNFLPERSGKSGNDLEEMKCTWFTARIASMDSPVVDRYFQHGTVDQELVAIVGGLFGDYFAAAESLIGKMDAMVDGCDRRALDVFVRFLEARIRFD